MAIDFHNAGAFEVSKFLEWAANLRQYESRYNQRHFPCGRMMFYDGNYRAGESGNEEAASGRWGGVEMQVYATLKRQPLHMVAETDTAFFFAGTTEGVTATHPCALLNADHPATMQTPWEMSQRLEGGLWAS